MKEEILKASREGCLEVDKKTKSMKYMGTETKKDLKKNRKLSSTKQIQKK